MTNLCIQKSSRKRLLPGDIFSMALAGQGFVLGRVISTNAKWTLSEGAGPANLLYVYEGLYAELPDIGSVELSPERLLIPPVMTNRLGWSRGYYMNLGNRPLTSEDVLPQHCFKSSHIRPRYFDEHARELPGPIEPLGDHVLHSYRSIEDAVCAALGIPLAPD